jgi:hypothetical protein
MITDQIIREGVEPGKYKDSFGFLRTALFLIGLEAQTKHPNKKWRLMSRISEDCKATSQK